MKILHIESGLNWGGQEFRNVNEVQWLNAHGHETCLVCDPRSQSFHRAPGLGVTPIALDMRRLFFPRNVFWLWRLCRREKIEIIQTHSSRDSWLCWPLYLLGYPVVRSRNITHRITRASRAFIFRHGCSRVIATADCIRHDLIEFARVAPERVEVVGEGVDPGKFNPRIDGRKFREEFGLTPDAPLAGMIAMLRGEKGAMDFVGAALAVLKELPAARFVVVGDGPQRAQLEQKIVEGLAQLKFAPGSPPPIILAGYRHDTPEILAALDVVVIPSHAEARGRVVVEAMATGRAVVATRVGGIPEVVHDDVNGLLVPVRDPAALAHAILRLLTDRPLRRRLGDAGLQKVELELSLDAVMRRTLEIYGSLRR